MLRKPHLCWHLGTDVTNRCLWLALQGKDKCFVQFVSFVGIQRLKNSNSAGSVFQLVYALLYRLLLLGVHNGSPRWDWKAAWTGWMGWGQQGQGLRAEFNAMHKLSHSKLLE